MVTEPEALVNDRMKQELQMLTQMPAYRMLVRHIVAAYEEYDSPNERAIPLARALAAEFYDRLVSVTKG